MIEQGYIIILQLKWGDNVPPLYLAEPDRMKFEHDMNKAHVFPPEMGGNDTVGRSICPSVEVYRMQSQMIQMFPGATVETKLVDKETKVRDHQTLE